MSAFASASTPEELASLLKKSLKELSAARSANVKKAKGAAGKNKARAKEAAAAVEAVFDKKEAELRRQHAEAEQAAAGAAPAAAAGVAEVTEAAAALQVTEVPDAASAKREKARLKKLKKKSAAAAAEREVEEAMASAGPTNRALEAARIVARNDLGAMGLEIRDVKADGHCLYRSLGLGLSLDVAAVRALAADALEEHAEEYAPFAMDEEGTSFGAYVEKVRGSAEWGGELELRAVARGSGRSIRLFSDAESSPLVIPGGEGGEGGGGEELLLSYHRTYYELGEHYNVVVKAGEGEAGN